jgi:hypothetical protein
MPPTLCRISGTTSACRRVPVFSKMFARCVRAVVSVICSGRRPFTPVQFRAWPPPSKSKQHDGFRTMGDVQWRRGENHRTVTLAG